MFNPDVDFLIQKGHLNAPGHRSPGRLVEHIIHAPGCFHTGIQIPYVLFQKSKIRVLPERLDILDVPVGQIVQTPDGMSHLQQCLTEIGADKTRASGD